MNAILLILLMKGLFHETPIVVAQIVQTPFLENRCPDQLEKCPRLPHHHEGRHPLVSDALLFPSPRLEIELHD